MLTEALRTKLRVKHICCDGARYHVTSWAFFDGDWRKPDGFTLAWCSEPFCENNIRPIEVALENDRDPAALCGLPDLKKWLQSAAGRLALSQGKSNG